MLWTGFDYTWCTLFCAHANTGATISNSHLHFLMCYGCPCACALRFIIWEKIRAETTLVTCATNCKQVIRIYTSAGRTRFSASTPHSTNFQSMLMTCCAYSCTHESLDFFSAFEHVIVVLVFTPLSGRCLYCVILTVASQFLLFVIVYS
jgi:hypothetical protein